MNRFLICLLSVVAVATARADHHDKGGFSMGGSFEGGFRTSFGSGATKGFQWLVDNVEMKNGYKISDKTKVTVNHGFAVNNGSATGATGQYQDSRRFFSGANVGGAAAGLLYSVREAYITHQCMDNMTTSVGLFRNVFGMENMWDRFNMHNYYYSNTHAIMQGALAGPGGFVTNWNYNLGAKFNIHGFEATLFQDANGGGDTRTTPGLAARYKFDLGGGDWTLTPVLSAYFGRFFGAPKDLGVSAGAMWKMGTLWANAEFIMANAKAVTPGATAAKSWSVILEPGFDLGIADFSAKWEFNEQTTTAAVKTNDMNLSAAFSKSYDNMRAKLAYMYNNVGGKLGGKAHEVRLLLGATW